jgi:hypothetical protein
MKIKGGRFMNVVFSWIKSKAGYEWEDCEFAGNWTFPRDSAIIPTGPYLVEKDLSQDREILTPFEDSSLFARFADLETNATAFEEWAGGYGLLTAGEKIQSGKLQVVSRNAIALGKPASGFAPMVVIDGKKNIYGRLQFSESLPFWLVEHRDLSFAMMVWELAINNDTARLGKIVQWAADNTVIYVHHLKKTSLDQNLEGVKWPDYTEQHTFGGEVLIDGKGERSWALDLYRPPDVIKPALLYVRKTINEKLQKYPVNITLQLNERGELQQKLQPSSMLAAMWYQFHLVLVGKEKLRRCAICGQWEDMKGHRETWKVHQKCASNKRVERFRKN